MNNRPPESVSVPQANNTQNTSSLPTTSTGPAPQNNTPSTAEETEIETPRNVARRKLEKNWDDDAVIASLLNGDHFSPNEANEFDNLAYHWRFFAMPDVEYLQDGTTDISDFFQVLDQFKQVVIAESGVTNFNITNVEIESVMGNDTEHSIVNNMKMSINEPLGVQFLDALAAAAGEAGIINYTDFHYFLELSFKGYEPDTGNIHTRAFSDLPNGGRWLWAVVINDIEVNMDTGGGKYTLTMLAKPQQAMSDEFRCINDNCSVKALTVKGMFDRLGTVMTNQWTSRYNRNLITHKFQIHGLPNSADADSSIASELTKEGIESMLLMPSNPDFCLASNEHINDSIDVPTSTDQRLTETSRENAGEEPDPSDLSSILEVGFNINFLRGTSVSNMVNTIFSSCEAAQWLAKDSDRDEYSADDSKDNVNDKDVRESVTFHAIPSVKNRSGDDRYDPFTNRYAKDITWHIYPKIDHNIILSHTQISKAAEQSVQKKTIAAVAARGFLPKRYDYLFTGENTEILNFDLSYNFAWQAALPNLRNQFSEQNPDHALFNKELSESRFQTDPFTETIEAREDFGQAVAQGGSNILSSLNDFIAAARRLADIASENAPEPPNTNQDFEREYIETILNEEGVPSPDTYRYHIPLTYTGVEEARRNTRTGAASQYHAGKSLYGAVLGQTYGLITNKFQRITIDIRGDPFWIGEGSYEQDIRLQSDAASSAINDRVAQYTVGNKCFLLRFKYPTSVGFDARIQTNENQTVTGVYQVTNITTVFDNGMFKHKLTAIKMPLIDIFAALSEQEANNE